MENLQYLPCNINWNAFVKHPMELIWFDSSLKKKQKDVDELIRSFRKEEISGWSRMAGVQAYKHLRLLYSMRSFLHIMSRDFFYFHFPDYALEELKKSFDVNNYNDIIEYEEQEELQVTSLCDNELFLFLQISADLDNSKIIFRQMLQKLFIHLNQPNSRDLVEKLINNVYFSV